MRQTFLFIFIWTTSLLYSQTNNFILNLTDTTVLSLKINLTTDTDIKSLYSTKFYKDPVLSTVFLVAICNPKDTGIKEYISVYYIKHMTVNLTCITSGSDSLNKTLTTIIVDALEPTKTSIPNFVLGHTTSREVESFTNLNLPWIEQEQFDDIEKFTYLLKDLDSDIYFGVKCNHKLPFECQTVDRLVISSE